MKNKDQQGGLLGRINTLRNLSKEVKQLNIQNKILIETLEAKTLFYKKLKDEYTKGMPWLAGKLSEFETMFDEEIDIYLLQKKRPAGKAADLIREYSIEKKRLLKKQKITRNYIEYYEFLFPWLIEYRDVPLDEILNDDIKSEFEDIKSDPVSKYLTEVEFKNLSSIDRNQIALDRFKSSRKSPHGIGKLYEQYVGYLYESKGYKVSFYGIEKGINDLGRDLICENSEEILIVQCKYWAAYKEIHENHINQLFGTTIEYITSLDQEKSISSKTISIMEEGKVKPVFVTNITLSDRAKFFADKLRVVVIENKHMSDFPMIKCNISSNGELIYHLPFDQQYDRVNVISNGGFYALRVDEAEKKGFRRAYRWKGI